MSLRDAMRRVITGDNAEGKSSVIIDGGPSSEFRDILFEIWEDAAAGQINPSLSDDLGNKKTVLAPRKGRVQVRWFVANPLPKGVAKDALDEAVRGVFAEIGGAHHVINQSRHPAMHETPTLDIVCLLQGEAVLILEDGETRLKPGNVVIQRGTNHAWQAIGGPALFVSVLIDRGPLSYAFSSAAGRPAIVPLQLVFHSKPFCVNL
jgi:hypothetical protein